MAKYDEPAQEKAEKTMHEMNQGKLKSGRGGKRATNSRQAVAIGLDQARREGTKVPRKAM